MNRKLPPLNGLRAFEAAARHMSFSKAAQELHVTAAAVSQQIKLLESFCNTPLFYRSTRSLSLTATGQAAVPLLREGFDKFDEAAQIILSQQQSCMITVSVSPSFGSKWLLPRLDRFQQQFPQYDVRIDANSALVDFTRDDVDIALRYGRGSYKGLRADCLIEEVVLPVCSPKLLSGDHPLCQPTDLRHHNLLHADWQELSDSDPSWRVWLDAAGVSGIAFADGFQ